MANLRSQLDRAIVAYLTGLAVAPHVYPGNSGATRAISDGGNVTVISRRGMPSPRRSGTYAFQVSVEIRYQAPTQPDETNSEANRVALDAIVSAVYDALMVTDDGQDFNRTAALVTTAGSALATDPNHADMAAFTVQDWYEGSLDGGQAEDEGAIWMEKLTFEAHCSSTANLA